MSTHEVLVVPVQLKPHPNADSLSLVEVFGWTCMVRTAEWADVDRGMYIPPDYVVPDVPKYAFLHGHFRIRVRRFRGVMSQGLLMPAPEGAEIGDNVMESEGIVRYEPPVPAETATAAERGPYHAPHYDIENFRRYPDVFTTGEEVVATEKIHGLFAKFVCADGRMYVGGIGRWKKDVEESVYWLALRQNLEVAEWCSRHPDFVVYAEVYGRLQKLKYGLPPNRFGVAVFDIWDHLNQRFLSFDELVVAAPKLPRPPVVYRGPFDPRMVPQLADGKSLVPGADHPREGIVIRPVKEQFHPDLVACLSGRLQVKAVSDAWLEQDR